MLNLILSLIGGIIVSSILFFTSYYIGKHPPTDPIRHKGWEDTKIIRFYVKKFFWMPGLIFAIILYVVFYSI